MIFFTFLGIGVGLTYLITSFDPIKFNWGDLVYFAFHSILLSILVTTLALPMIAHYAPTFASLNVVTLEDQSPVEVKLLVDEDGNCNFKGYGLRKDGTKVLIPEGASCTVMMNQKVMTTTKFWFFFEIPTPINITYHLPVKE